MEEILHEIKEITGAKNIYSNFFSKQRNNLHSGSINIKCLNPIVYRQFVNKTHKIYNSHVTFTSHLKSLEETLSPSEDQQKQIKFCDIDTALINNLKTIQKALSSQEKRPRKKNKIITEFKENLKLELRNELKALLPIDFKNELTTQKEDIIITINTYTLRLNSNIHDIVRR